MVRFAGSTMAVLGLLAASVVLPASPAAAAGTATWDGGGADALWSNPLNWAGDALPALDDTVVFPPGLAAEDQVSQHDLTGFTGDVELGAGAQDVRFALSGLPLVGDVRTRLGGFVTVDNELVGDGATTAAAMSRLVLTASSPTRTGPGSVAGGSGALTVSGDLPQVTVTVADSGDLELYGTVAAVVARTGGFVDLFHGSAVLGAVDADDEAGDGRIRPGGFGGDSGHPVVEGDVTLGDLAVDSNANTPRCDTLVVHGSVTLATAQLLSGVRYELPECVIVDNDGEDPIEGTFEGIAEGGTVTLGGHPFRVTYLGGDGNDIAVEAVNPRVATTIAASTSPSPSAPGEDVTLHVALGGGAVLPIGEVYVSVDGVPRTPLYAFVDATGVVDVTLAGLAAGARSIEVSYPGDAGHLPVSTTVVHQVGPPSEVDPVALIDDLLAKVAALPLPGYAKGLLRAPLLVARIGVLIGFDRLACSALRAFSPTVGALRSARLLTAAQAADLRASATELREALGC